MRDEPLLRFIEGFYRGGGLSRQNRADTLRRDIVMSYPGTRIRIIIGGRAIPAIVTGRPVV